jgi:SpoVK/Ycf46/Vps4 family AAA+-type ATPase
MPGLEERVKIWQLQIHPTKTPLAPDVDFQRLAAKYAVSGGDIKNAVLKAAVAAAGEAGPAHEKRISQRHFEVAMDEVVAARSVMKQSVFDVAETVPRPTSTPETLNNLQSIEARWRSAVVLVVVLAGASFLVSLLALTLAFFR